jgi:thiopurine S-methyltransferase
MELSYWQSRWDKGNIGFHMQDGYPALQRHWPKYDISKQATVLVPLCGKSIDMDIISRRVKRVVGVEVSDKAIEEFFSERRFAPVISSYSGFKIFKAANIEIWQGDFFKLPVHRVTDIDLIYDKASLVALPPPMRKKYAEKVLSLSGDATKYLLHHFIYNSQEMQGPPFSVSETEIKDHFSSRFTVTTLEDQNLDVNNFPKFKLRGLSTKFRERFLLLTPK